MELRWWTFYPGWNYRKVRKSDQLPSKVDQILDLMGTILIPSWVEKCI